MVASWACEVTIETSSLFLLGKDFNLAFSVINDKKLFFTHACF